MHRDGVSASGERVLLQGIDYHGFFGTPFREDDYPAGGPVVSRIRLEVEALLRRDVEELMEERGVCVCYSKGPSLANAGFGKFSPLLADEFKNRRWRPGKRWRME